MRSIRRSAIAIGVFATVCWLPVTTAEASPGCRPDWNDDGAVSVQDIFDFLTAYFNGAADFNGDGGTSVQDIFDFLAAYFAGCTSQVSATPNVGGVGTVITLTVDPTVLPQGVGLTDGIILWTGRYIPMGGSPTPTITADWTGFAFATSSPNVAGVIVGGGVVSPPLDPSFLGVPGILQGAFTIQLPGGTTLWGPFQFSPETEAIKWRNLYYTDGPASFVPPEIDDEASDLRVYRLSQTANPQSPTLEQFRAATGAHYLLQLRIARNQLTTSQISFAQSFPVFVAAVDSQGNTQDEIQLFLSLDDAAADPNFIIYRSSRLFPFLFVDMPVSFSNFPSIILMHVPLGGRVIVKPVP